MASIKSLQGTRRLLLYKNFLVPMLSLPLQSFTPYLRIVELRNDVCA